MGIISNLLFGDGQKKTSYEDALKDKYYNEGIMSNYDRIYGGLNDYLDKAYEGGARKYKSDIMQRNQLKQNESTEGYKNSRYNVFGNGFIGSLLNPIAQTFSAAGDLAGMALSGGKVNAWDSSKNALGVSRDVGSDLGALGETALTVLPMAHSLKVAKAGKAVNAAKAAGTAIKPGTKLAKQAALWEKSQLPKTIGQKVAGGAMLGAGYGASGSLRDMGFENFDPGQLALSTAIGGGVGGGLAGIGGLWNKYSSGVDKDAISKSLSDYAKKNQPYQDAMATLKSAGIEGKGDALEKSFNSWATANHPDKVGNAVALLPANTQTTGMAVEQPMLFSNEKVSKQFLDSLTGSAKKNNPYIQALDFKPTPASYMKEINAQAVSDATKKFNTIQDAMNIVKNGQPKLDLSSIPRKKAGSIAEGLSNIKNNLITTNPNGRLSRAGTKISSLLKTKKGKVLAGAGGGLLLAKLLNNKGQNANTMSDEELQELYNYIYGGGQ